MADEPLYVLDACAVIALLQNEPGAEVVSSLLAGDDSRCVLHVVNLCEVFYDRLKRGGETRAAALVDLLTRSGIEIVAELPLPLWERAGHLKAELRRISLADSFVLALAMESHGAVVTSDPHEFDPVAAAGICEIRFIRP